MRINHNIPALNAYNNLAAVNNSIAKSMERLSSGLRINRAADDAAGLAISEKMRGQIRGLSQASRNAQDAISLIQTAEGALTETHSMLHRMRELSVQAANDTYTSNDRMEIQKEIDQLKEEIDRIANTTSFNNKNLLDGSASALFSSDKLTTKIIMRGGLRVIDQFGQKAAGAGNYKLEIAATAGEAQIQKSDLFKNKHAGDRVEDLNIDDDSGIQSVTASGLAYGTYQIQTDANTAYSDSQAVVVTSSTMWVDSGSSATTFGDFTTSAAVTGGSHNASILMEVKSVDYDGEDVTNVVYSLTWIEYDKSGNFFNTSGTYDTTGTATSQTTTITLAGSASMAATHFALGSQIIFTVDITSAGITAGDKVVLNFKANHGSSITNNNADMVQVNYDATTAMTSFTSAGGFASSTSVNLVDWRFSVDGLNNKTTDFTFFNMDSSGTVTAGTVSIDVDGLGDSTGPLSATDTTDHTTFEFGEGLGQVASLDTVLRDIDKFWDSSGNFILQDPQTITMIQGDGAKTTIQLYGSDTIQDVVDKLNEAIGTGLSQADLVSSDDADRFVSYVTHADAEGNETVAGTFVIRSAKAGKDGELNFIGNEQLINALSLAEINTATESKFSVTVTNAHDPDDVIASSVTIQGNLLAGVVHDNVDVKFDSNADINVTWDEANKEFALAGDSENTYTTYVHLVDNTQVFQIGANEMQDMGAAIGAMNGLALGINSVLVTDRVSAGRSITILDDAISKVSSQRASLGAVQNRLEHTISNLGVAAENLTAAESRIRDVDMAYEMMEFSKMNILSQAATAMLAQANQLPQAVLQLLGR